MASVSVCVRFRPQNKREIREGGTECLQPISPQSFAIKDDREELMQFTFDKILYEASTQSDVFEVVAKPAVMNAMNAVNGTIIAYGQTGAGKTFTMEGPDMLRDDILVAGLLPRVVNSIFESIAVADASLEFVIKLSMVEIYCDRIRDLLDPSKDNLPVKEDKVLGVYVANVTETYAQNEQEMLQLLQAGITNRAVCSTHMNEGSSRSHCVHLLTIQQTSTLDFGVKTGKLCLVDLAGSEKVAKTGVQGQGITEAKNINKSLSTLANVINALTSEKSPHIPYRDSKLTRILQDSLGGNSSTTLLCCCSPSSFNAAETISTLRFGMRAKQIKNKPVVNEKQGRKELEIVLAKSKEQCKQLTEEVEFLTSQLSAGHLVSHRGDKGTLKAPSLLTSAIATLQNILKEEGHDVLSNSSTADTLSSVVEKYCALPGPPSGYICELEKETERTLSWLEGAYADVKNNFQKVLVENEELKTELRALRRLIGDPSDFVEGDITTGLVRAKPRILKPLRGGLKITEDRADHSLCQEE